jgi:hypothetical protein
MSLPVSFSIQNVFKHLFFLSTTETYPLHTKLPIETPLMANLAQASCERFLPAQTVFNPANAGVTY